MTGSINKKDKLKFFQEYLDEIFPDVDCELNFSNNLELLIAVLLSAQCKDEYVNRATPELFNRFKTIDDYADADVAEIENYIKTLGLYKAKSKNIKNMAIMLREDFNYSIPNDLENLIKLPGVGRKTANVVMSVGFNIPAIAVDTHVERVSKRLKFARKSDSPLQVEYKLMKLFPKDKWSKLHHQLIHFGRYKCKAKKPECSSCELYKICSYKINRRKE
ncbi:MULTISPECIES: endonuclease III [unclassified Gemella]|uniref:endonuclease III n=1 Tax=unclassified Gemella TaxID=2624949 RepID=UPI001C0460FD|nr:MULTISPECIES: endonuclease III [unclassified Gemella]MBU0278473.1 endonuclease III [Gemella sp. zg-1178]QWQ39484.1 endonuclease III [Gemella sp. zg-570]